MPSVLECGKLRLSTEEAATYCAAAERLHEACEMVVDSTQPITIEDWILLDSAHAALADDLGVMDAVVASIEAEIGSRRLRN